MWVRLMAPLKPLEPDSTKVSRGVRGPSTGPLLCLESLVSRTVDVFFSDWSIGKENKTLSNLEPKFYYEEDLFLRIFCTKTDTNINLTII